MSEVLKGRSRRTLAAAVLVLATAAIAASVAWATDVFSDVPTASPHHADINAVAGAGITGGCAPGLYCPDQAVRRDQMASFLHRAAGRLGYAPLPSMAVPATETALWTFSITPGIPAGGSGTGFVKVDAKLNFTLTDGTTCPCDYYARLATPSSGYMDSSFSTITLYNTLDVATIPLTGAIPVTSSAHQTIQVNVLRFLGGGGGTGPATVSGDATATYYPFGGTGGSTLGEMVTAQTANDLLAERSAAEKAARGEHSP